MRQKMQSDYKTTVTITCCIMRGILIGLLIGWFSNNNCWVEMSSERLCINGVEFCLVVPQLLRTGSLLDAYSQRDNFMCLMARLSSALPDIIKRRYTLHD